ncbi:MAG: glycosyltransferase family 4 protein [Alphaproteobacteria bacterium]|nr:glycosyltransferase family 4 protein [Alphaproteobacteria bacterium]
MTGFDLALPGRLDRRSGGTIYDRRIVERLRAAGARITVHEMSGSYPAADAVARAAAAHVLARARRPLVIDGLALPAFRLRDRDREPGLIALVHHPLAEETGLAPAEAAALRVAERADLARVAGAVVTSRFTARTLAAEYGMAAERIAVVQPGVDRNLAALPAAAGPVRLLSVAAFVPRKGHDVLFQALQRVADLSWSLTCVGAVDRDPELMVRLRKFNNHSILEKRINILGELTDGGLAHAYGAADVFVHPALYEGYGMALSEALSAGLPIVATRGGAVPDTVPEEAGILVAPGDVGALADALRRVIGDAALRRRLAAGSAMAGGRLAGWPEAAADFAVAVARLAA